MNRCLRPVPWFFLCLLLGGGPALQGQLPPPIVLFRFGGPSQDGGTAVATDSAGDFIMAGFFQGNIDFDPGPGTAFLYNPGGADMVVAKYNRLGRYKWAWNMSVSGGSCIPHGIAVDANDNILVAGHFGSAESGIATADFDPGPGIANVSTRGGTDPFVAKYDREGKYQWVRVFNNIPSGNGESRALDLAVDDAGNVYLTGFINATHDLDSSPEGTRLYTSQGGTDVFLLKYDAAGNFIWGFGLGGIGNDEGLGVALDDWGGIYLMGSFAGSVDLDPGFGVRLVASSGYTDLFVARFTTEGSFERTITLGGFQAESASPGCIRTDAAGNVYIAGRFRGTVDFDPGPSSLSLTNDSGSDNTFVASYAGSLALRSAFPILSKGSGNGTNRITVDSQGALWIAGWFAGTTDFDGGAGVRNLTSLGTGGATDIFVARYDGTGNLLWAHGVGSQQSGGDRQSMAAGLAVDRDANAYISGHFFGQADFDPSGSRHALTSSGLGDGFVARYDAQGNLLPTLYFPRLTEGRDLFTGIAVANWGATDGQITLAAYANDGSLLDSSPSIVNPGTLDISAGGQAARLAGQIFNLPAGFAFDGWIEAQSTTSQSCGFFLNGNTDLRFLDGTAVSGRSSVELYFTRAHTGAGFLPGGSYRNVLHVINPNAVSVQVEFRLLDEFGNIRGLASRRLNPKGRLAEEIQALFGGASPAGGKGYVRLTSSAGVIGYQSVESPQTTFGLPAQGIPASATLSSAQFASGAGGGIAYFTDLNLINLSDTTRSIRAVLIGNDGTPVTTGVTRILLPGQQERVRGDALFGFGDPASSPLREGSLVITADGAGIIGDVVFGDPVAGRFVAGLPLDGEPASDLVFSQVAQGSTDGSKYYFTGLAIYNANDTRISVTMDVYSETGARTGSSTLNLERRSRVSRTLPQLVPAIANQLRGYIRLTSAGGPIVACELFGDQAAEFLAAVPPQAITP